MDSNDESEGIIVIYFFVTVIYHANFFSQYVHNLVVSEIYSQYQFTMQRSKLVQFLFKPIWTWLLKVFSSTTMDITIHLYMLIGLKTPIETMINWIVQYIPFVKIILGARFFLYWLWMKFKRHIHTQLRFKM